MTVNAAARRGGIIDHDAQPDEVRQTAAERFIALAFPLRPISTS